MKEELRNICRKQNIHITKGAAHRDIRNILTLIALKFQFIIYQQTLATKQLTYLKFKCFVFLNCNPFITFAYNL
jgi:hypothetical protein